MKIVLIGFMCSGKSKVGRILSKKLGWAHHDTDEMIVKDVGRSIAEIITSQGEPAFRDIEHKVVRLVSLLDECVVSTGGGVPLDPANMKELSKNAEVVWLKVKPETVLKRVGNVKTRPLIDPKNPLESIRTRLSQREKFYATAAVHIDTDDRTPEEVADAVLKEIPSVSS